MRLATAHALVAQAGVADLSSPDAAPVQYLQTLIDGLCELSLKDPLTGLANRRQLLAVIDRELDRVARSGEAALLLILDIDHFKQINDRYGHNVGDQVLRAVTRTLEACTRPMDTLARIGGEEFALVLPACQAAFGKAVAERVRRAIESVIVQPSPTQEIRVTISIGGAFALQWIRSTSELWLERADQQLYRAKAQGRNCVCIEEQPDSTVSAEEKHLLFDAVLPSITPDMDASAPSTGSVY